MEFPNVSIFQLLTRIQQALKTYQQNNFEPQQTRQLFKELQCLELSPEIVFQQLIANKDKIFELKSTLLNLILNSAHESSPWNLGIESQQKIDYNQDSFLNTDDVTEILRKISAIKGQAMFINQELSIQRMEKNLSQQRIEALKRVSLRKLIKEYMKRCRSSSKLQFLTPICIRLVVLQESIMVYLQKTLTLFCSMLNQDGDYELDQKRATIHSMKSVSSLSASIEQFLEKQNRRNSEEELKTSTEVQQCRTFQPIIRSDFIFERVQSQQPFVIVNGEPRRNNCCLWF